MTLSPDSQIATAPATASENRKPSSYLPAIDSLRALAALGVVYVHCWVANGINLGPQFTWLGVDIPVYKLFVPGFTGVFLFFALSGFCLSYPYFARPDRPIHWRDYFISRIWRILPAYIISFVIIYMLGHWLHSHVDDEFFRKFCYEKYRRTHFIQELFLIRKSRVVSSYWTLVLEWRWYLLFPVFLILSRRIQPCLVVLLTCGLAVLPHVPALEEPILQSTFSDVLRTLPMFGLGIWAAYLCAMAPEKLYSWERALVARAQWGLPVAIAWCVWFHPAVDNAPLHVILIAWGSLYFLLILAAVKCAPFNKIMSWGPLVKIGGFSYSLYLIQEPFIRALNYLIHRPSHGPWTYLATNFILLPILTVAVGWAFFQIGERPFLKRRKP